MEEEWDYLCSELGILEDKEKQDLIKRFVKRSKEMIVCKDGKLHAFQLIAESSSGINYYQIQRCQLCGYERKTDNWYIES